MNTKTVASLIFVASLSIVSCKKELQPQESSTDTTAVANTAADPNAITPTPIATPTANQPIQVDPAQMQATPAPQAAAQPATVAKGMNPAHGQPGHRCDIAVGAPLNSPPGKTPTPTQTAQTTTPAIVQKTSPNSGVPKTLAAPAETVVTAPGMNPPHGQAGHDCAVAVGAPLPKKE